MRVVAHLASVHNRTDNRVFYKQCIGLAGSGYSVKLIVGDGKGDTIIQGVEVLDFIPFSYRSRLIRIFIVSPIIMVKALKLRVDLYHIHDPELLLYYLIFSPFFGSKKVIFDMHENLSEQVKGKLWVPRIFRGFLALLIRKYENLVFRKIPVIFAENSYVKHFPLVKKYEIVLNYPSSNWANTKPYVKQPNHVPTIGYIGRIGVDRGIDTLLASIVSINKLGRKLQVELIGNIPQDISESVNFKYLDLRDLIKTPGFVPNDVAVEIVKAWDVGFCVLKDQPNFIESYPTKLFEYFVAGVPVVTSNFPLYQELVEVIGGGICISPDSEIQLSQAITKILNTPDKYSANIDLVEYGWSSQLSKLVAFYRAIL